MTGATHAPSVQLSPAAHALHAAPFVPHELCDSAANSSHCPEAVQQPSGHDAALHPQMPVATLQSSPCAQAAHAAPPVPHDALDSAPYGSHVPVVVQQPFGHDVASQTHCPFVVLHAWPAAHALHTDPVAPHEVFDSLPSISQVPFAVQQPLHDPPPQLQAPIEHAWPFAHELQAAPAVPQVPPLCDA
jgi:hypothetical protein